MKLLFWCFLFLTLLLQACASTPPPKPKKKFLPKSQSSYSDRNYRVQKYNDIDVNELLVELGMDHPMESVGFREKSFNTCQIESNHSPAPQCQQLYISRLNFQVMCRNSTGTVQSVQLTPLFSNKLRWKNKHGKRGLTSTNGRGYGSLGFISQYPANDGYLYLYLGSKIARKRFQDKWKLILPMSWCDSQ